MSRITQELRDEITSAMMGVMDRYDDVDQIDMPPLARDLSEECCRIVESVDRGRTVLPVQVPSNWEATSRTITISTTNEHQKTTLHTETQR